MKKLLFFFAVLLPLHLLAQTTYYVSNSGSDSNSGTSESSPWESLNKVNIYSFSPGDQILFKRGDQWEGTITVNASGTSGNPIVYGAYGSGDKPKIYGSEEITGWTLYSGNIYQASYPTTINQLFIDDERMKAARYPTSETFKITSVGSTTQFTSTEISNEADDYYIGASVLIKTNEWRLETRYVTASTGQTLTINTSAELAEDIKFVLINNTHFIMETDTQCYVTVTDTIYLKINSGDSIANHTIKGSVYDNGFYAYNKNNITVSDLEFNGYSENGVKIKGDNITILNCNVNYSETGGIVINGDSCIIQNNTVDGVNQIGISMTGDNSDVSDNEVFNTALFGNLGIRGMQGWSQAMIIKGDNNIVGYNRVVNSAYNGINWNGKDCSIEYNYIENVCSFLRDGGGIYTWSSDVNNAIDYGSVIRYNIINKTRGTAGIYIDDRTTDISIEDNTIINSNGLIHGPSRCTRGIFLHNAKNIIFRNNILFNNQSGFLAKSNYEGCTINNNLFCNISTTPGYIPFDARMGQIDSLNSVISLDSNIYVDRTRTEIFRVAYQGTDYSFSEWQTAAGKDPNSTLVNTSLEEGEEEELLYNDTKQAKIFDLRNYVYTDIYGEEISGELTLEPFTSQIVIKGKGTEGNTGIFENSVSMSDRRAMPFTFSESGEITSISLYHEGSTGDMLLAVYSDDNGYPGTLLGITPSTELDSTSGWQTVSLTNEVFVSSGQQVWLAWLFENPTRVHYTDGVPGRAYSSSTWNEGMPADFGSSSLANYIYSIYCSYDIISPPTAHLGNTEIFENSVSSFDLRAMPFTFNESGDITNISLYHQGSNGDILLAVYSDNSGYPGTLLGVTPITEADSTAGWQTVSLADEVYVSQGDQIWLAWLFENPTRVHYTDGAPGRAYSTAGWSEGMPVNFGSSSIADYIYSIYCTYIVDITKSAIISPSKEPTTIAANNLTQFSTEEITINEGESYLSWTEPGTYQRVLTAYSGADSIVTTILTVAPAALVSEIDKHDTPNLEVDEKNSVIAENFKVYPNPANTYVNIECEAVPDIQTKLIIMNSSGETLLNTLVESTLTRMDISHLPAGIYFVRMVNGKNDMSKKLVIDK